jgi:hypothetical protein|tara:strand:+ start:88 stop:237 length:150 start_codon:yes stop_codon:yes gene_type:complete
METQDLVKKNKARSTLRGKDIKKAILKASDNGRCWWIEQYLRNSFNYYG